MSYPIKTCVICGEEFELKPGKPGYANRCPECSEEDNDQPRVASSGGEDAEMNEARRLAIRDLLYRGE